MGYIKTPKLDLHNGFWKVWVGNKESVPTKENTCCLTKDIGCLLLWCYENNIKPPLSEMTVITLEVDNEPIPSRVVSFFGLQRNDGEILNFQNEYTFLDNSYESEIDIDYNTYSSVQDAYEDIEINFEPEEHMIEIIKEMYPFANKEEITKQAWEFERDGVMYTLVKEKFTQNEELAHKLLQTKNSYIEYNKDVYWGKVDERGQNSLGKILMQVREELKYAEV